MRKFDVIDFVTGDVLAIADTFTAACEFIERNHLRVKELTDDLTHYVAAASYTQINEFGGINVDTLSTASESVEICR